MDTGRVWFAPGLALSKLQERMEFVTLHPLDADVVIEDFMSFDEVSMMISGRFGGLLVSATAEHAADLLSREFPLNLASKPILKYDVREDGVDVSEELQERASSILNSQTSETPRRSTEDISEEVSVLSDNDQMGLDLAVLVMYLRKVNVLANMNRAD